MSSPQNSARPANLPPSYQSISQTNSGHRVPDYLYSAAEEGHPQGENQPLVGEGGSSSRADVPPELSAGSCWAFMGFILFMMIVSQWKVGDDQSKWIGWGPLKKDEECLSYGTARYQARLEFVPPLPDPAMCLAMPIRIHQKDVLPTECHRNNVSPLDVLPCKLSRDRKSRKPKYLVSGSLISKNLLVNRGGGTSRIM